MRKCLSAHARHVQQRKESVKHAIVSNLRLSLDPNIRRSERALDIFHFFGTRRLRDQKLDNAVFKSGRHCAVKRCRRLFLRAKNQLYRLFERNLA